MTNASMRWTMALAVAAALTLFGELRGESAQEDLQRAATAVTQRDEAEAWQLFQRHRASFNEQWFDLDWQFVAWVADQLRRQQEFSDALALCSRVMERESAINPELAAALIIVRGDVFRDQQNYAAARLEYAGLDRHQVYRQTAAGRKAQFRLLEVMRVTREYEAALQLIERLKDTRDLTVQAEAFYHHAHIAFDREDYDLAREMIVEVKKRLPEHVETVFLEGELNLLQNRLQDPELEIGERRLQTFVIPGRPIVIRMQDPNLAVARGGGGIPILLTTSVGRDRESIVLMPSPRDPTMFRGSIRTVLGQATPGNMVLELLGDDRVVYNIDPDFQRNNDLSYEDKHMTVVSDAELNISSGEFIDQEERDARALRQRIAAAQRTADQPRLQAFERVRDINTIRPGNPIYMQVEDHDRSVSSTPDQVRVKVQASSGAFIPDFKLIETEANSGVFRAELPTMVSPPLVRAVDSAPGHDPGAVIDSRRAAEFWRSAPGGPSPKWLEVDLMRSAPIRSAKLALDPDSQVQRVSLMAGTMADIRKISDSNPSLAVRHGFLDLGDHFKNQANTAAYVYTQVISPVAQNAVLRIGSADGFECWVNGVSVRRSPRGRTWTPEQEEVEVSLEEGVNGILLKVNQISGTWGVSLNVRDAQGASLTDSGEYPSLVPGAVTQWHVFDLPLEAAIEVPRRITVSRSVRVGDRFVRWVPKSTAPVASLVLDGDQIRTVFHGRGGWRRLRWMFDDVGGPDVGVREVEVVDRFNERLVPGEFEKPGQETSDGALAIGPGDTINVEYFDEKRTREDDGILRAQMRSGYHNASVLFEYEQISTDARGNRQLTYDRAVRYRPGHSETMMVRVIDYDEDRTSERDTVTVTVSTTHGQTLELTALETEPHSGEFVATLRLGEATDPERDTIGVRDGDDLRVRYYDMENSDGEVERTASVVDAGKDPPQLVLFQTAVIEDTEGLLGDPGSIRTVSRLPAGDPQSKGDPVVTSLESPLRFEVLYPMAALSVNASFPARLVTLGEREAALAEGREPEYLNVTMNLKDVDEAIFGAEVRLLIGDSASGSEVGPGMAGVPVLSVRGTEDVIVEVTSINPGQLHSAVFRLASDGRISFTDRRYDETADTVHAGDYLYMRVIDADRSISDTLDSIEVSLTSRVDSVRMTLVETLPHSGIFTGRIRTELAGIGATPPAAVQPVSRAAAGEDAVATEPGETESVPDRVLRVAYGDTVRAVYMDEFSVLSRTPVPAVAVASVHRGDDGMVSSFTRRFRDDEMAVQTRLLTAEALFEMAKEHRRGGLEELADEEMFEGKQLLEEAVVNYPGSPFAAQVEFLLANLAQEIEAYEEALERYNRVLSVWPDSEHAPRALLRKAQTLEAINDDVNAADTYVELTYSYPDSPMVADSVVRLGQLFYRREDYPTAARVFANFERNYPENPLAPRALFLAGQSFMKGAEDRKEKLELVIYDKQCLDWMEDAVGEFRRLISGYEAERDLRAESMYWMGDLQVKLGDMREAYMAFTRLRWDYPESNWARFARGRLTDAAFRAIEKEM